jgi:plasmid maintenance system killer protein
MIVSYADKRTADFAGGKRVKAFDGIDRPAQLKLDRLESAQTARDLAALPGQSLRGTEGRPQGSIQYPH